MPPIFRLGLPYWQPSKKRGGEYHWKTKISFRIRRVHPSDDETPSWTVRERSWSQIWHFQSPRCLLFSVPGYVFYAKSLKVLCFSKQKLVAGENAQIFKELYPKTVVIIDAVEFRMQSPSALDLNSACYSSYKGTTTMKELVGISPLGMVSFMSELYTGSIPDKELTKASGLYKLLSPGDDVMADTGFDIQDDLAKYGVTLHIPAFLKGSSQFSIQETRHNKKIATLRIHVERGIERIKNWHIFEKCLPIRLASVASEIYFVVGGLINFQPPLID